MITERVTVTITEEMVSNTLSDNNPIQQDPQEAIKYQFQRVPLHMACLQWDWVRKLV